MKKVTERMIKRIQIRYKYMKMAEIEYKKNHPNPNEEMNTDLPYIENELEKFSRWLWPVNHSKAVIKYQRKIRTGNKRFKM